MTINKNFSTLTPDERLAEAHKITEMFEEGTCDTEVLSEREKEFVSDMVNSYSCSEAQLNWLRRIKEKAL